MSDYKIVLGYLAVVISLVSYIPYFRDLLAGRTKPHAFSWLVWSILTGIAFTAQVVGHGGPGAWVTGVTTATCIVVFILSLFKGEKDIVLFDWMSLGGAFAGLALWAVTHQPVPALVLISIVDTLGLLPTFRKSYYKPYEETASTFAASTVKYVIAFFALQSYSFLTWYYLAVLIVLNAALTAMLVVGRRRLEELR